ncbi:MAG TPA: SDR family oxidoreductase [Thermotogota bacterium]|nr:SDR family oxidoreductase [Thermotogota bacterium]HRW92756.1 SDR family oxidoreductase [Thermotogota bacterium]
MILVTGATGHIGNVLVRTLLQNGQEVRALLAPGEDTKPLDGLGVEMAVGDVRDPDAVHRAMEGIEEVYHLAGIIAISPGKTRKIYEVNVGGTQNVLLSCMQHKVKRMVHCSSIHALAEPPRGGEIHEGLPFDPGKVRGHYGKSKAMASLEVLQAAEQGLDVRIICPTGVIGPYDFRLSEMGHVVRDISRGKLPLCFHGNFDFVDVRDVANGAIQAMEKGERGQVYLLGNRVIEMQQMVHMISDIVGHPIKVRFVSAGLASFFALFTPLYYAITNTKPRFTLYAIHALTRAYTYNHSKASVQLGFCPRDMRDSLSDTIRWFQPGESFALG